MGIISVISTDRCIRVKLDDLIKSVSFRGTRMAGDEGMRRTARQVAIRWAEMTGTSYDCASLAWRRCEFGRLPSPSKLGDFEWEDILTSLDAEISDIVNDPNSKYYIYG